MHLVCLAARFCLPSEGIRLFTPEPLPLLWDCHHGDTFVMKVGGLAVEPYSEGAPAEPISLEIGLAPPSEVLAKFETFAAHHNLPLSAWPDLPAEVRQPLTLAACHLPEAKLFVYCDQAVLSARATPEGNLRLIVSGDFNRRKIPCQETDLVLHLERADAGRLLSYCFTLVRGRL
ncbi:MAG: hypothetical protein ACUVXF_09660 [Desulfobaccales bacterium]